jgi:kumamolisin
MTLFSSAPFAEAGHSIPGSGSGAAARALTAAAVSVVPAALQVPWALRTGFSASYLSEVPNTRPATGNLAVSLQLWPSNPSFFQAPAPGARGLSVGALADQFGLSPSAYAALESYFSSRGLTIVHAWPDRLSLTVAGPAGAVGSAFGASILQGNFEGRTVTFPGSAPALPAPYAGEVASISGLTYGFSQFTMPYAPAALPSAAPGPRAANPSRSTDFVTPADARMVYDLSGLYNVTAQPHYAVGEGIALLLWGDGYDPADINAFISNYYPSEFPSFQYSDVPVDGAPAASSTSDSDPSTAPLELTLDLEWAGSMAPGATLYAVHAPDGPQNNNYSPTDTALEDALNTAVNSLTNIRAISMSFGTPDGSDPSFQAAFALQFAKAANRGITLLAASGDNAGDTKTSCTGGPSPQFPAASPDVLAVGGTAPVLAQDPLGQVTGLSSEPAWNDSGGGYSNTYSDPSWQLVGSAAGPIGAHGFRGIPDVAGPANRNFFFYNGSARAGQGTSFATPMWAGLVTEMDAVSGEKLGFLSPRLYVLGAAEANGTAGAGLVDITAGSNCLGPAVPGWDDVTGWGSPRALTLYLDIVSTFVNVTLMATPSPVLPGGSLSVTVTVLNLTSHRAIANLPVLVTLAAEDGYSGPCGGSFATATLSTNVSGSAVTSLALPGCYFGSQATVTAVVQSNGFFGSTSSTVNVNLDSLAGFLAALHVYPYNVIGFAIILALAIGIAYGIGEYRHKRARARAARARAAAGPRTMVARPSPPGTSAAPARAVSRTTSSAASTGAGLGTSTTTIRPPGPPPEARTPVPGTPPPTSDDVEVEPDLPTGPVAPPTIPDHVMEPPGAAPSWNVPSGSFACPVCHTVVPAGTRTCPSCGAALDTPG